MHIKDNESGFTLIEIAIVLVIVTILLGYTVAMFPVQQELKQYREVNRDMNSIIEHLIAFAQVNGRLPCPDIDADGLEDSVDLFNNADSTVVVPDEKVENCSGFYGDLPSGTLGITGKINANGQLLDPWSNSYRYAVSESDVGGNNVIDFVSPNEIRNESINIVMNPPPTIVSPDLFICNDSDDFPEDDLNCDNVTGGLVMGKVAAVIISLGKSSVVDLVPPLGTASSNIQRENLDDFLDGTNDKVYISTTRSDAAGTEYDDVVKWISPNLLFSKMIEADQLP